MKFGDFAAILNPWKSRGLPEFENEFRNFAADIDISEILADQIATSNTNYRHTPPIRSRSALFLGAGDWFVMELVIINSTAFINPITTERSDEIYYFLSDAECEIYELENFNNEDFSADARAVKRSCIPLAPGSTLPIYCEKRAISLKSDKPILALILSDLRRKPFGWDFDKESGKALLKFNSHPVFTVFELYAQLLGEYGDEDSVPALEMLLNHRSDSVQWHAVSALTRINPAVGIEALKRLRGSNKASVANFAKQTLTQLEGAI